MNLTITRAVVVQGLGSDKIPLETNLPSPTPAIDKAPLVLNFVVTIGLGPEYVRQVFGIEAEVVKLASHSWSKK